MFYHYAYATADQLEKLQMGLFSKTGITWNDNLAEDTDNEGSDGKGEHLQNIPETEQT